MIDTEPPESVPRRRLVPGLGPNRSVARLVVMVALLAVVAVATLTATTAARGQGDGAADASQAQPEPATQAPPAEADAGEDATLSKQPLYRISQLYGFSPIINGIIIGLSVLAVMFFIW
ncbi:MAG: hypothetical protein ACIAXF_07870, partial [Phycisphaerales bacterium JB063]